MADVWESEGGALRRTAFSLEGNALRGTPATEADISTMVETTMACNKCKGVRLVFHAPRLLSDAEIQEFKRIHLERYHDSDEGTRSDPAMGPESRANA